MKKLRIVERTYPDKSIQYIIQGKHWLFGWVDAHMFDPDSWDDSKYPSYQEAIDHLYLWDGSKPKDRVVYVKNIKK